MMSKRITFMWMVVLMLGWMSYAQNYAPGTIHVDVRCESKPDYTYLLYLPKNYDPDRAEKWPVMFIMSPNGGNKNELARYVDGAEYCDWIIVMSKQSKNYYDRSGDAVIAMFEDVSERFPINEKRCYSSGFSGGSRRAFELASLKSDKIIGIIGAGAGHSGYQIPGRASVYGLAGAICPNRTEIVRTHVQQVKDRGVFRFHPGKHGWPDSSYFLEAMVWMNGKYFEKQRRADEAELTRFSNRLMADIKETKETDAPHAYEMCQVLVTIPKAPDVGEAEQILGDLEKDVSVQTYRDVIKDIEKFAVF
ncbi:MAG: hypothetical protein FJ220_02190, partial [Kiritimatiellaceae bacterium]|nr:hypothetical protein [Kiritimatiellaceae bacterium]